MRHTELWARMQDALGPSYYRSWAEQQVLADLGGHTVVEALAMGEPPKRVWLAVWRALELPDKDR